MIVTCGIARLIKIKSNSKKKVSIQEKNVKKMLASLAAKVALWSILVRFSLINYSAPYKKSCKYKNYIVVKS